MKKIKTKKTNTKKTKLRKKKLHWLRYITAFEAEDIPHKELHKVHAFWKYSTLLLLLLMSISIYMVNIPLVCVLIGLSLFSFLHFIASYDEVKIRKEKK